MRISELMCENVKACYADQTLADAARIMWEFDCGCVPVIDRKQRPIGILTDRDICMATYLCGTSPASILVSQAMAHNVLVCRPQAEIPEVETLMQHSQVRRLPVADSDGMLVGIISLNDLAQEAARQRRLESPEVSLTSVAITLGAVSRPRSEYTPM